MQDLFFSEEQYRDYQDELAGDGFSAEYQRAFFQSQLERPLRNDEPQARRLTLAGKFVVMASFEVCCPVTDGLIGYDYVIQGVFDSLDDAKRFLDQDGPEDIGIYRLPEVVASTVPDFDDEIPF